MTVEQFKDALVDGLDVPVYHIMAAPEEECPVLCWQPLPGSDAYGDDAPVVAITHAQLDYFTVEEYDPTPQAIERLLTSMDVYHTQDAMTYDADRAEWRHIWTVEFIGEWADGLDWGGLDG